MTTAAPTTSPPTTLAPTTSGFSTAAPTTAAPTTAAPTTVPPTTLTTAPPTTAPPTTLAPTTAVPPTPAPALYQPTEISGSVGHIPLTITVHGEWGSISPSSGIIGITMSIHGSFIAGVTISSSVISLTFSLPTADIVVQSPKSNFVAWSKIGDLDFTIDESNLAGERPMDWSGWVLGILKLRDKVVVYGANGVSFLIPKDVSWGMQTIHRLGVKSKGAVVGTDFRHHFIDTEGCLYELSDQLTKLDYSEFLSQMTNPVMSLDIEQDLIYICDNTYGYVYSIRDKSLGECPVNITGLGTKSGTLYVVGDGEIETPAFEICTDTFDFATRKNKTIEFIEVGTDLTDFLEASIDFRTSNRKDFQQIGWYRVNPDGKAYTKCFGTEFRIRLRSYRYEYFEIDYLKIHGVIHNYGVTDFSTYAQYKI